MDCKRLDDSRWEDVVTLNLELPADLVTRLQAEAQRRGIAAESIVQAALEVELPARVEGNGNGKFDPDDLSSRGPRTPHERALAFESFLKSCADIDTPEIPAEFLRREHIYEDRGL